MACIKLLEKLDFVKGLRATTQYMT